MDDLTINQNITIPGWELWFTASRSGGPGGQHVNKTSTRVTLYWRPDSTSALDPELRARVARRLARHTTQEGLLQLHVDETRSQHRNREIARERLCELIERALVRQRKRVPTRPSRGARRRRLESKRKRGETKALRKPPSTSN